ncbi:LytTR family transcriptional regulator, partial [bacterium]
SLRVALSEVNKRHLERYADKLKAAVNDYISLVGDHPGKKHSEGRGEKRTYLNRFMIKSKDQISMISVDEIDWIESAGDYVYVHSKTHKHIVRETLTSLEERMDPAKFIRIHRSSIVNLEKIKTLRANEHGDYDVYLQNGTKLKLSRTYRSHFENITGNPL